MRPHVLSAGLTAIAALVFTSAAFASEAHQEVHDLINRRLALMMPVAAWKLANDAPVEDLEREKLVMETARENARAVGLDPTSVGPFVQEQMNAAKMVQKCWIDRWRTRLDAEAAAAAEERTLPEPPYDPLQPKPQIRPPENPPDLATEIRPELLSINASQLASVKAVLASDGQFGGTEDLKAFDRTVRTDCLTRGDRNQIYRALMVIKLAE